jgi:hypothetical protein
MERSVKREYMENRTQYQNPLNIATNQTTGNTKQNDLSRKDNNQHEEINDVRNKGKADNSKEKTKEKRENRRIMHPEQRSTTLTSKTWSSPRYHAKDCQW